jgi:hypothetical protein
MYMYADVISALDSVGLINHVGLDHSIDITPKQLNQLIQSHRIQLPTHASNGMNGTNVTHKGGSNSKGKSSTASASNSNTAVSSQLLKFKPELLHWTPPSAEFTSPTSSPTSSHKSHSKRSSL